MKPLIILSLLIVAISGCKDEVKHDSVSLADSTAVIGNVTVTGTMTSVTTGDISPIVIGRKELGLQIGDRFYFGYDDKSPSQFKVIGFNKEGVYCVWSFQDTKGDPRWFPYRDIYYAKNFKKL